MSTNKRPPCPNTSTGKHAWQFVKNAGKSSITHGPSGSYGRFSVVALYRCECGATRTGAARADQPGADLRTHFPAGEQREGV